MVAVFKVIGVLIRKEFLQVKQDKRMLAVSFIAPLLQVFLLGYAATTDIRNSDMVICDLDKTAVSREFIQKFSASGYFIQKYSVNDCREIDYYIETARATAGLVIPTGFGEGVMSKDSPKVQFILDGTDANTARMLLGYATLVVAQYSRSIILERLPTAAGSRGGRVTPEPRVWFNPDLRSANFMVPGVVALVLMIITMTLTSLGIVKEKEIGTLEQLLVTPIKPYQLILGKLIPFVIIGFVEVLLVLAVARFWFEVPLRGSVLLLFGLSGMFILTTLGLGIFISTISKSQQQAMLIAQFFFFMPFMFLSGFAFPIANMPIVIQYITYVIPLRYFLEIIRGIFLKGSTMMELWPQAVVLFIFGVTILTLSIARFKKQLG